MKVRKRDIGHRCTVAFDEEGHVDAMLVGKTPNGDWTVYIFASQDMEDVISDQIIEIGELIRPRP
jgi:hypothetical protein